MEPGVECLKLKGHVFLEIGCLQLVAASPLEAFPKDFSQRCPREK